MKLFVAILITLLYSNFSFACPKVNFDQVLCNDITNSSYFKGHLSLNIYEDDHSHILSAIGDQFFWFVRLPSVDTSNGITQNISCVDNKILFKDTYNNETYTSTLTINENGFKVSGFLLESSYACDENGDVRGCRPKEPRKVLIHSECLVN